jgi:Flp pilus assembly protein protease CpaA
MPSFFPNPEFGWVFFAALTALLGVAAYTDTRRLVIPKKISLTILGLGVLFNVVRGAWLGAEGKPGWAFDGGPFAGAADGFLFALAGFVVGFGVFFLFWVMGTCGGGDVKLFAALAAWLGPKLCLGVLAGTLVLLAVVIAVRAILFATSVRPVPVAAGKPLRGKSRHPRERLPQTPARPRLVSYALPLAVVTVVVGLWVYRTELNLADAPERSPAHASART